MQPREQRLAVIARKLEQAHKHAEDFRGAVGAGDHASAWAAAIAFKKTLAASKHLLDFDKRVAKGERK